MSNPEIAPMNMQMPTFSVSLNPIKLRSVLPSTEPGSPPAYEPISLSDEIASIANIALNEVSPEISVEINPSAIFEPLSNIVASLSDAVVAPQTKRTLYTAIFTFLVNSQSTPELMPFQLKPNTLQVLLELEKTVLNGKAAVFYSSVENKILAIFADNKLNTNDIPMFIVLMNEVYAFILELKELQFVSVHDLPELCSDVILAVLQIMMLEKLIPYNMEWIQLAETLLMSCIVLMKTHKLGKPKLKKWFNMCV